MISIAQALTSFQTQNFKNIYILLGKEKFFHDQIINKLSELLFSDPSSRSLNRLVLHGTENTLPEIVNASISYPMLSQFKLVLVKEFNKIKITDSEPFLRYLENPQKTTILLLSCEENSKTKLFSKALELAETIDCKPVPEYKVAHWIKDRITSKGLQISAKALMMLTEYTGNNLLTIDQEINKITDFKSDNTEITEDTIIAVTGMSREYNVFTFQKSLVEKDFIRSYTIGKNLVDGGENLNLIISIVYNFFKKALLIIKNPAAADQLKISDYQKKEIRSVSKKFDLAALENTLKILNSIDRLVKTSAISQIAVMQNICYNICRR